MKLEKEGRKWKKVFSNISAESVVVIDRATYHLKLTQQLAPPASNLKKLSLHSGLLRKKLK